MYSIPFTSAETFGENGQDGEVGYVLAAELGGNTFTIRATYTYVFPDMYARGKWEFTIPEGHDSTYGVIGYFLSDTYDPSGATGYHNPVKGTIGLLADCTGNGYSENTFLGFRFFEDASDVMPHFITGADGLCGVDDRADPCDYNGYVNSKEFENIVGSDPDAGIQLSFHLGGEPGTKTVYFVLAIDDVAAVEALEAPPSPPPQVIAVRAADQATAYWIGTHTRYCCVLPFTSHMWFVCRFCCLLLHLRCHWSPSYLSTLQTIRCCPVATCTH
jgi:hypothetical protein